MSGFGKRFGLFIASLIALIVGVGWFSTKIKDKPYGVHDLERDKWDRIQADIRRQQSELQQLAEDSKPFPRLRTNATSHNVGVQFPFSSRSHLFTLHNDGDAPLTLTMEPSKDGNVTAELPADPIAIGESQAIAVHWQLDDEQGAFSRQVTLNTNDPRRSKLSLTINGLAPAILAFSESAFTASRVEPDQLVEASSILYSQVWSDFTIEDIECDLETFRWSAEKLPDEECKAENWLSAYRVNVSVSRRASGKFLEPLVVKVSAPAKGWRPEDTQRTSGFPMMAALADEEPLPLESNFSGRVISRINFYGEKLDRDHGLEIGLVARGKRHEFPLTVRCRGNLVPDQLAVLDIQPPELRASITPSTSRPGTYRLAVIVPEDAKQVVFNADQKHGYVKVGDPENDEVSNWFPVMGAIVDGL